MFPVPHCNNATCKFVFIFSCPNANRKRTHSSVLCDNAASPNATKPPTILQEVTVWSVGLCGSRLRTGVKNSICKKTNKKQPTSPMVAVARSCNDQRIKPYRWPSSFPSSNLHQYSSARRNSDPKLGVIQSKHKIKPNLPGS